MEKAVTIFPTWFWYFVPNGWIHILFFNFIGQVLFIPLVTFLAQEEYPYREFFRKEWKKSYLIKLLADFVGSLIISLSIFSGFFLSGKSPGQAKFLNEFVPQMTKSAFSSPLAFLWVLAGVVVSGWIIYRLNDKYCYKDWKITEKERKRILIGIAITLAPSLYFLTESALLKFFSLSLKAMFP